MSPEQLKLTFSGHYSKLSQTVQKELVSEENLGMLFDSHDVNKDGIIDTMEANPPPKTPELGSQGSQGSQFSQDLIGRQIVGWAIAVTSALPLYKDKTTGQLKRTLVTKPLIIDKIKSLGAEDLDALTTERYSKLSQTEQKELVSEENLGKQFDTFDVNTDGIIDDRERGVKEKKDATPIIIAIFGGGTVASVAAGLALAALPVSLG